MNRAQMMKSKSYSHMTYEISETYNDVLKQIEANAECGIFSIEIEVPESKTEKIIELLIADGFDAAKMPILSFSEDRPIYIGWVNA